MSTVVNAACLHVFGQSSRPASALPEAPRSEQSLSPIFRFIGSPRAWLFGLLSGFCSSARLKALALCRGNPALQTFEPSKLSMMCASSSSSTCLHSRRDQRAELAQPWPSLVQLEPSDGIRNPT